MPVSRHHGCSAPAGRCADVPIPARNAKWGPASLPVPTSVGSFDPRSRRGECDHRPGVVRMSSLWARGLHAVMHRFLAKGRLTGAGFQ